MSRTVASRSFAYTVGSEAYIAAKRRVNDAVVKGGRDGLFDAYCGMLAVSIYGLIECGINPADVMPSA